MTIAQPPSPARKSDFFSPHLTLSNKYLYDFQYWLVLDQASKLAAVGPYSTKSKGENYSDYHLGSCKNK